jgi:hypothetical protein
MEGSIGRRRGMDDLYR